MIICIKCFGDGYRWCSGDGSLCQQWSCLSLQKKAEFSSLATKLLGETEVVWFHPLAVLAIVWKFLFGPRIPCSLLYIRLPNFTCLMDVLLRLRIKRWIFIKTWSISITSLESLSTICFSTVGRVLHKQNTSIILNLLIKFNKFKLNYVKPGYVIKN